MAMIMIRCLGLVLLLLVLPVGARAADDGLWQGWSADLFERAKAEERFVILDLEAVWCHWCHAMKRETYADGQVIELLKARYIPVRVDQDSSPELAARYGDWGWPATIVFAPDGTEIVKRRGYIPPPMMASLLQAIIDDPSPGPSVLAQSEVVPAREALLPENRRAQLGAMFRASHDAVHGGFGDVHRFLQTDAVDLLLTEAAAGDGAAEAMARRTLDGGLALIDPVWGGVYQYSDKADWSSPHYEKIMWYQAQVMRQYAIAGGQFREPRYTAAALAIRTYLERFLLSPEGAFAASQDADLDDQTPGAVFYALDDLGRRALGVPRIDRSLYARENGWAVSGLVALANATGDEGALALAELALFWVVANRSLPGGGFSHGDADRGGPYLGDSIAVGQAALDLYGATGKREWLDRAAAAGDFVDASFRIEAGFATAKFDAASVGVFAEPVLNFDEAVQATRFLNALAHTHGGGAYRALAEHGLRWLGSDAVSGRPGAAAGVLIANAEAAIEPMHITIVGRKDDPVAIQLHKAARAIPAVLKRLDWWDVREGPMINPDVTYPELETAAAFACSNRICSEPVLEPEGLLPVVERMLALR
jgi:hypothetical protein